MAVSLPPPIVAHIAKSPSDTTDHRLMVGHNTLFPHIPLYISRVPVMYRQLHLPPTHLFRSTFSPPTRVILVHNHNHFFLFSFHSQNVNNAMPHSPQPVLAIPHKQKPSTGPSCHPSFPSLFCILPKMQSYREMHSKPCVLHVHV